MHQSQLAPGFATPEGTSRYAARFPAHSMFYRTAQGLAVSSLGIGSYLGELTTDADRAYEAAMLHAVENGINFMDTSLNYRNQRSEINLATALRQASISQKTKREEIVVCTKAGFLVRGAIPSPPPDGVAGGMHSISPMFLRDQLNRSRLNLGLQTIDVFYLHNPETQLEFLNFAQFDIQLRAAFEALEELCAEGAIRFYGTATWNGYRQAKGGLDPRRIDGIAREVAGDGHRFRFVQLPFNLGMTEALSLRDARGHNVLDIAAELGITVVASASILQARLAGDLPPVIEERLKGFATDAQRAIQFARSAPGVSVALVGMGRVGHVAENLGVAAVPPASAEEFRALFH